MALMFPLAVVGTILMVIAILFLTFRKHPSPPQSVYNGGTKVANTKIALELPAYLAVLKRRNLAVNILCCLSCILLVLTGILAARPTQQGVVNAAQSRRDIMLCLDISTSLDEQNHQVISTLRSILDKLDGDRVGLVVFNTTAILDIPLTDDYEFIQGKLDGIEDYFASNEHPLSEMSPQASGYLLGTTIDAVNRGSSLIGDGLGTALYSFPDLEESNRTRVIILSTDNDQNLRSESPTMSLMEAAQACADNNTIVISLFPDDLKSIGDYTGNTKEQVKEELRAATELTGGTMHEIGGEGSDPSSDVASAISFLDAKNTEDDKLAYIVTFDRPEIPLVLILVLASAAAIIKARWRI